MDYNDNDYEGQNLHLAGEDTSRISSVLRPFTLPKFEFDDSLHGHLRFDSLVENEVFLGIPSQEDNQWIEDFSRGSSGIEFSSSATESCALPRRNNVWSEATSSESVEMLLKAVGQEEMVPDVIMIEESGSGDQPGSSAEHMETNLMQDNKMDDVHSVNPSLPPAEVDGDFSRLNQSAGVEDVHTDCTLQAQEKQSLSSELRTDDKDGDLILTSEKLNTNLKSTSDNQGETLGLVGDSMTDQENLPVPGMETDNTGSTSQNVGVEAGESGYQDKACENSFVSSLSISKDITKEVEEQKEGIDKVDERLSRVAVEAVDPVMHHAVEISPVKESSSEEQAVEIPMTSFCNSSSMPDKGESIDRCDAAASAINHASAGINQPSEDYSISSERLSVSFQGEECVKGFDDVGGDTVTSTICISTELKQVHVTQLLDQQKSSLCDEVCPGSNSSLDTSHVTSDSSVLPNVLGNPSEQDIGSNNYLADVAGNLIDSSIAGECCERKSVTEDIRDVGGVAIIHKELEDEECVPHPSLAFSTEACGEDVTSMHEDVHEHDLHASACKKNDNKLPIGLSNMVCDVNEKKVDSSFPGEGVELNHGTASGSQFSTLAGDYQVLNAEVEDANPKPPCVEGDESAALHPEHGPPSLQLHYKDQDKETETESTNEPRTSIAESIGATEVAPIKEDEMYTLLNSDSVGGTKACDPSVSLTNTSSAPLPHEACKELNEGIEHLASNVTVPNYASEAAATERLMAAGIERSDGTNSPVVSISRSAAESDHVPVVSYTDLPESQINEKDNLSRNDAEIVGGVLPASMISGVNALSKEEGTFTFDTRPLGGQSIADSDKGLQSFPRIQACKLSLTGEGPPSTSGSVQKDLRIEKEVSQGCSIMPSAAAPLSGGVKTSERKSRRGSSKSVKGSAKKGSLMKETTSPWHTDNGDKPSLSFSPVGAAQLRTFESAVKPRGTVTLPTSRLPDLNTSSPSPAYFQQPFTDLQQVQLRAQIFVYGSLIQGAAPDEACMVSAFDGGRSLWEPSWRACVERHHCQKNQGNYSETPLQSHSGAKASGQASRHGLSQSEVLSTPAARASNKAVASPIVNPNIPLSSPLWNISTPSSEGLPPSSMSRCAVFDYQAVSSLNPYQTPPMQNFMAHTSSWPSQAIFPVPWPASSQSSPFDISSSYSAFPITEPVKLNPVKESPFNVSSGAQHLSQVPAIHTGVTTMFSGTPSQVLADLKKVTVSSGQTSGDTKTRKRKKSSGVEDVAHIPVTSSVVITGSSSAISNHLLKKLSAGEHSQSSLIARNRADSIPTAGVACHYSTSIAVTTPSSFVPTGTSNQFSSTVSPSVSSDHQRSGDLNVDKRAQTLECFRKVEEAKLHAEEAAAQAAVAVSDCQCVWSQLNQHQSSGLTSDVEAKLASAAVAIAAAASVAKAAAAAAKIASSAAVQAKQMADEAMTNMVNVTPSSILKGSESNTSAISAAREAAKRRVEAASTATRHAENLDAIIKAAELAAEAVSHTAKIVGVSDPFSLSELVKEGPDRYWKVSQVAGSKSSDMNKNKSVIEVPNVHLNLHEAADKGMHATDLVPSTQIEVPRNILDNRASVEENEIISEKRVEKHLQPQNDKRVTDFSKAIGSVSEQDIQAGPNSTVLDSQENTASFKEGSVVEVLKDHANIKEAWFPAKVQNLKDGEVLVYYTELQNTEGSEQLKEWVSVEAHGDKPPAIRIPHPMTAVQFEGTRKRRRSAAKDYTWSVGDKVDAWVQDCWREGIVADKNEKDATTLTIHFPAQDEKLSVKVWHLRPTLIWNDGQWIEWCRSGQDGVSQGDTPMEKRQRRGNASTVAKEKGSMTKNIEFEEVGKTEKSRLDLAASEKVFNIGAKRDENKPNLGRTMRSGLQKEGPRVVFGVPKPGKKRKFMDVSKHYVSDRSVKPAVPNDSSKLSKFLTPQASGSRGPKNNSKLDVKDKQTAESKSRAPPKSWKPPSIPSRTLPKKDDSSSSRPASDAAMSDYTAKDSMSDGDNESGEQNLTESGSFSNAEETSGGTFVFSSRAVVPDSRSKASNRNKKPERLNKGKLAPAFGRSAKSESDEKTNSEASEPRRSNRRIQPTSRLLEGLQSSLLVSKIPSSSHEKSQRNQSKSSSSRGNNRG